MSAEGGRRSKDGGVIQSRAGQQPGTKRPSVMCVTVMGCDAPREGSSGLLELVDGCMRLASTATIPAQ